MELTKKNCPINRQMIFFILNESGNSASRQRKLPYSAKKKSRFACQDAENDVKRGEKGTKNVRYVCARLRARVRQGPNK